MRILQKQLSAPTAARGCAQKVDNHQWPLSLFWMRDTTKISDLHAQLEGRILLIMCSTLGGHFPTSPSFVLEAAVVILVHKHNA
eukprot:12428248-Karenia_brevis.AAC.1